MFVRPRRYGVAAPVVMFGAVLTCFFSHAPSSDRPWAPDVARVGAIERHGPHVVTIRNAIFAADELHRLRESRRIQFIDARVSERGAVGHTYFHENPAVSSDLILYLRYGLPPGAEFGRPLGTSEKGFWVIDDKYPGPRRLVLVRGDPRAEDPRQGGSGCPAAMTDHDTHVGRIYYTAGPGRRSTDGVRGI